MNVNEARELMKSSFREDAVTYAIKNLENKIREWATKGYRNCIVSFYSYPGGYNDFIQKYGEDNRNNHKQFNVEQEIKEHFTKNGFTFKLVTDDICGGVRQDPYWIICW